MSLRLRSNSSFLPKFLLSLWLQRCQNKQQQKTSEWWPGGVMIDIRFVYHVFFSSFISYTIISIDSKSSEVDFHELNRV